VVCSRRLGDNRQDHITKIRQKSNPRSVDTIDGWEVEDVVSSMVDAEDSAVGVTAGSTLGLGTGAPEGVRVVSSAVPVGSFERLGAPVGILFGAGFIGTSWENANSMSGITNWGAGSVGSNGTASSGKRT